MNDRNLSASDVDFALNSSIKIRGLLPLATLNLMWQVRPKTPFTSWWHSIVIYFLSVTIYFHKSEGKMFLYNIKHNLTLNFAGNKYHDNTFGK